MASSNLEFRAAEYHADTSLREADYRFEGSEEQGWRIDRNGRPHLELGPGYRVLRTLACGVCSTDLDRHFLPFPLPQIIGHELVAVDDTGQRYVVEINASHAARCVDERCAFCDAGLATHCPERLVLGIHDLPGGFGPFVLAPVGALLPLADDVPLATALLIEPFAAALNAVETVAPRAGETLAVLGPRRLGLLAVAALAAHRKRSQVDFEILAIARQPRLLELARELGATRTLLSEGGGEALDSALADVVIDTTASPQGLELAVRLARREVHLKSTHGQPACGLSHLTELVVDELALARFPQHSEAGSGWLASLGAGKRRARIAWMAKSSPPAWLSERACVVRGDDAAALLAEFEMDAKAEPAQLPRVDAAVVETAAQLDHAIRPSEASESSLVRPRGDVVLLPGADPGDSTLLQSIVGRGLRLSGSRCGDFHAALDLVRGDPELLALGSRFVTHRFGAHDIRRAFETARSAECIKAMVEHEVRS